MGNTIASACRRLLFDAIFRSGPEFYWKGKPIQPMHEFKKMVHQHWIPFCKRVIDWICIAGIVPITFQRLKDGNWVPVVPDGRLGVDYDIVITMEGDRKVFQFVRLRNKKGVVIVPKIDTRVYVKGGFGYDPLPSGELTSIVSTIIPQDYFLNRITNYTLRAEFNRSDPQIVTETVPESFGVLGKQDQYDYYGDWDKNRYEQEAKYRLNRDEIIAIIENQKTMMENAPPVPVGETGEPIIDKYKKQTIDNIFPLPVNHKLTRQNMPESRNDWVQLNRHNESLICAAYNVPRAHHIQDEGMSETSVRLAQTTLANTVNGWKTILSQICTDTYNCLYHEDDCKMAMYSYSQVELSTMSEEELFDVTNDPRVTVGFPMVPTDTDEGMLQKYALGMFSFDMYRQLALTSGGYPANVIDSVEGKKDPWNQQYKLQMVRSAKSQDALQKLAGAGTVVFPVQKPLGPAPENKDKDKKRKTKDSSSSSAPKKKPKEKEKEK